MSQKNKSKTSPLTTKIIFAIIFLTFVLPFVFLTFFLGSNVNSTLRLLGKIMGLFFIIVFSIWGGVELIKSFKINTSFIIIGTILLMVATILPMFFYEGLQGKNYLGLFNNNALDESLTNLVRLQFRYWPTYLIIAFATIILVMSKKKNENLTTDMGNLFIFLLIISFFSRFFWIINIKSLAGIILIMVTVVITDTCGLFGGKYFGHKLFKRKLAPTISPTKTIEGALIAYVLCVMVSLILNLWALPDLGFSDTYVFWILYVLSSLILPFMAIIGDLFFSSLKRYLKIKDFSNFIKGHGGIFDRLDSMSFVVISFALIITIVDILSLMF